MSDLPDPTLVRERETYSFPRLRGAAKEEAIAEYRRIGSALRDLLALPFEWKVAHAKAVVTAALARGAAGVSWSGGQGSGVLLHLVQEVAGAHGPVLFANTGVEFVETVRFVRSVARAWDLDLHEVRPQKGMTFRRVVQEYGWPALGKEAAGHSAAYWKEHAGRRAEERLVRSAQAPLFPVAELAAATTSPLAEMTAAVRLSAVCCYHLKEEPLERARKELGLVLTFVGIQAVESERRRANYIDFGELYYSRKRRTWMAYPLALWTRADLQRYEEEHDLPRNPLYTLGYERTGCWPCLMMVSSPTSRHLQTLRQVHPQLHRTLMLKWGAGEVVLRLRAARLGLPADALLRAWGGVERVYEMRPCWFDGLR